MTPTLPHNSTPATPKRISVFSSSFAPPAQPLASIPNASRFSSPSKKRQMVFGTPPVTRTPSRAAPLSSVPATPRADILKQLPDPPQFPEGRVGYDPELRAIISNHEESLTKLVDRYSRLKMDLSHQLNVELAESEHQRTNAKCELAVVQKQVAESVESNEKLKQELLAARNRLNKLMDDRRGMELKLSELNSVFSSCQEKFNALQVRKNQEKSELSQVIRDTKNEVKFLELMTGLTILIVAPDRLKFNFKLIDMNAYDRVFHVELDISEFDYRVISLDPPINEIHYLLKNLNLTRDFNSFLCEVRKSFNKSMKT